MMSLRYFLAAASMAALLGVGSSAKALETEFIFTGTVSDFYDSTGDTFGENGASLDGAAYVSTFYINTGLGTSISLNTTNPDLVLGEAVAGGGQFPGESPVWASLEINGVTQTFVAGTDAADGDGGIAAVGYDFTLGEGEAAAAVIVDNDVGITDGAEASGGSWPQDFGQAFSGPNTLYNEGFFALPTANGDLFAANVTSPGSLTSAAPEPSSWLLMIAGVGVVGGLLRRRGTAAPVSRLTPAGA